MGGDGEIQRVEDGLVAGMAVEIHSVPIRALENADDDEQGRQTADEASHMDNGARGTLMAYDEELGRWHVAVWEKNSMRFVRAAHLRPLVQDDMIARVELAKSLREHARKLEAQAAELLPPRVSYGPVHGHMDMLGRPLDTPPHGGGPGGSYGTFPEPEYGTRAWHEYQREHGGWSYGLENLPVMVAVVALCLGLVFG